MAKLLTKVRWTDANQPVEVRFWSAFASNVRQRGEESKDNDRDEQCTINETKSENTEPDDKKTNGQIRFQTGQLSTVRVFTETTEAKRRMGT